MSNYAKILTLSYDSAVATKLSSLKTDFRSVRLLKIPGTVNPGKESYITNVLLCGNCIDPEKRRLYVFYIDTFYQAAWIIEIGIDNRVQKVVLYDRENAIGFNPLFKIYNPKVVNGKMIFTENKNPIYQIDIERAKASYYYGIGYDSSKPTVNWQELTTYTATQIVLHGRYYYRAIVDSYNTEPGSDSTKWTRLCGVEEAYYSINIDNFYFAPIPPKTPPEVEYYSDDRRKINNLKRTLFQVAYRYVYMDWRRSTFSPASIVPLPQAEEEVATGLANEIVSLNNSLKIIVNTGGEEVRAIEVIARSSDDPSTWYLIDTIEKFKDQETEGIDSKRTLLGHVTLELNPKPLDFDNLDAPVAPVATVATNLTSTGFTANWNASTSFFIGGYLLDVAEDAAFTTYVEGYHNKNVGNVTSYDITGLTSNNDYFYRVRAYSLSYLISLNSNTITVVLVLAAPVALEATDVFETGMTANWMAVEGATGYYLDVAEDIAFTIFVAGYNNLDVGNVLTKNIVGLVINTVYFYRLRAYNALGTSASSNIIDQRTQAPPDDVVAIAATDIGLTSFMANWNAATGATGYYLDVATDAGFTSLVEGYDNRYVGDVITYLVRVPTSNTLYYYRIRGTNAHNVMSINYSNTITVLTLLDPPVATTASGVFGTGFTANWGAVTGATGYYLDISTVNTFATFVAGYNNKDVGNVISYDVTGLVLNTTYYYRVRAYNLSQTSVSSNTIVQRTSTPPDDPIATVATAIGLDTFTANWDAATGAVGYYLDVATDSLFASKVTGYDNRDVGNVTSCIVRGLSSNTQYYYRVRAYDNHLILSGYSNTVSVKTLLDPPVATTATNITAISFSANWTAVTGATGYYLDVSTDSAFATFITGFNGLNVGSVNTYSVTGLSYATTYYYRVRAYNSDGSSANSNTISQRTIDAPPAPVATPATSILYNGFTANWNASVGAVGYYLDVATDAAFTIFATGYNNRDIGNLLSCLVRGLNSSTTYYYRVRAYDMHGLTSANSNTISAMTDVTPIPAPPVAIAATGITYNGFTANWNASAGATGYYLDVSNSGTFITFVTGYNNRNVGNVLSFAVTGLNSSEPYYFRVRAYNADGTSASSNTITLNTIAPPVPTISLNPAVWNFGGVGINKVIVVTITNATSWNVSFPSASGYIHEYTRDANSITLYYSGPNPSGDTLTFTATGVGGTVSTTFTGRWT